VTVALIDVDGLHAVNTSLGHAAGDEYLTAITTRLAAAVPDGGCLVRQGGDEFTLLAPGADPTFLATAIGAALAGRATIAGYRMQPRASVGIAASGDGIARFDAGHARGCADAALYSAKAAGGNRILVYDPDRDGVPEPDGSRPLLRRRDIDPLAADGVAWLPSPSPDLVPLLLPIRDLRTIHHVLGVAADRWAQTAAEADAGNQRPHRPAPTAGDSINIQSTPGGYRSIAHLAQQQATSYTQLAQRLAPIIDATAHLDDPATPPGRGPNMAAAVLVGISAAFTADEIEALVITAAAVHGRLDDLSRRQRELAARAHTLLHDADA
jgi:diguanylate cyclase (GGDEF)-like protein